MDREDATALCVIENPEADQEIVAEAKKVLLNLANLHRSSVLI